LLNQQIGQFPD